MKNIEDAINAYKKYKNLKLAAEELGYSWQNLYVILRKNGVPVTGDKERYGSDSDRLAARAEKKFLKIIPYAVDMNRKTFQSKIDFMVGDYSVDVKSGTVKQSKKDKIESWMFSVKKQEVLCDFFVMFAVDKNGDFVHTFLVPSEVCKNYTTVRISERNKWFQYKITNEDLKTFFDTLCNQ
jgi:hypothetical protein